MPAKPRSTPGGKKKPGERKKTAPKKSTPAKKQVLAKKAPPAKKQAAPIKPLPVESLKKTIAYFYLLAYCPPDQIAHFNRLTGPLRKTLAKSAGMNEAVYFKAVLPKVCTRIVAYSQASREPDQDRVRALVKAAGEAGRGPEEARAFQELLANISRLPGRAKPENRLHRKKGCQFCRLPCHYGYFTLVSDPQFGRLQRLLEAEARKPDRQATRPVRAFATQHMTLMMGTQEACILSEHLGNLAYCLLMLAMAKSRLALPEAQLMRFQAANR